MRKKKREKGREEGREPGREREGREKQRERERGRKTEREGAEGCQKWGERTEERTGGAVRHWSTFQGGLCVRQTLDTFVGNDLYDEASDKKVRSSGYAQQPTGLLSTKYVVM